MSKNQKNHKINLFQQNKTQILIKSQKLKLTKIQKEYQKAFEIVAICPKVRATFYGGARVERASPEFINIQKLAQNLADIGVGIASGGGTGIMEASLLGAQNALENWKKNQENGNSVFQNLNQNPNQKFSKDPVIKQKIQQNNLKNSIGKFRDLGKSGIFGQIKEIENWQNKNENEKILQNFKKGKNNLSRNQNLNQKTGIGIGFRMNITSEIPSVHGQIDTLFTDFGPRKWALRSSQIWIFAPGGFGTLDELMENLTLFKLARTEKKLVFLYNSKFWSGLLEWLKSEVCGRFLADKFEDCFILTDSIDEILSKVKAIL